MKTETKSTVIIVRVTEKEKRALKAKAKAFKNLSEMVRPKILELI